MATTKNADTISAEAQAPQPKGNVKDTVSEISQAPLQDVLPVTKQDNRIFIMQNDKRQGNLLLPLQDVVFDPDTKRHRAMRVLRGVESIWKDEQPVSTYPESYVDKNIVYVTFSKGTALVPANERNTVRGMELLNNNMSNPNRLGEKKLYFKEWNSKEEGQKEVAKQDQVIKAMKLAFESSVANMVQHASYLNIPFNDEQGVAFEADALRAAYLRYANSKPREFLESIESPVVKISFAIKKNVQEGNIDLSNGNGAYWSDGGFICALPEGEDAVSYLVKFAQAFNDKSESFKARLME